MDEPVVAQALVKAPSSELVMVGQPVVSVMSHFVRRFDLTPGTQVKAVSVMGHAMLDFRGAVGGPGIVEARCVAVMGSIEIIVPPDIHVEIVSSGFWGSVEQIHADAPPSPDKPTLRITGVAVMGSIEVKTTPGEHKYWREHPNLPHGGRGRRRLNRSEGPHFSNRQIARRRAGRSTCLFLESSRPHAIARRVSRGSITSSTRPQPATL